MHNFYVRLRAARALAAVAALACIPALSIGSSALAAEPSAFHAGKITAETPEAFRIRGSDAIAGIGDWHLSNGTLCAAILGVEHHGQLVPGGGSLVDVGYCGRDDDQWLGLEPLYNFSREEKFRVNDIHAGGDGRNAQIVTTAGEDGISLITVYGLDAEYPERLSIRTRIIRDQAGPRLFAVADILLHAESALRNFMVNDGGQFSGFRHPSREHTSYLTISSAIRQSRGIVLVGSEDQGPPISYLYRVTRSEAKESGGDFEPLGPLSLGFSSVSVNNIGTQPPWLTGTTPRILNALQYLAMDIPLGGTVEFDREVWLSKRADVASHTDRLYTDYTDDANDANNASDLSIDEAGETSSGTVTATVRDLDTRVHVFDVDRDPPTHMTMARPDPSGLLSFTLPNGHYRFDFIAPGYRKIVRNADVDSKIASLDLGPIEFTPNARINLPSGIPMRLVFDGIEDTRDPLFGDDLSRLTLDEKPKRNSHSTRDVHLSGGTRDETSVEIAPGRYRVFATRGPEFSLTQTEINVAAGDNVTLAIESPVRLFETNGWVSGDFHVHAAPSFDSTLAPEARLRSFAAEGASVLVATEHDMVRDYSNLVSEMGLEEDLAVVTGLEVTTIAPTERTPHTTGHVNVYPFPYRPELNRGGAIQDEGLRLRDIIARARDASEDALVQVNHPRRGDRPLDDEAFFDHLSIAGAPFEPTQPIAAKANRSLIDEDPETGLRDVDFDTIELLNGFRIANYRIVQRDWFSLIAQGHRITGLANSDSHKLSRIVGVPRNYVKLKSTDLANFDQASFITATRNGQVYGTTGPLLSTSLAGAGPGDRFRGSEGMLSVTVKAAPWVPVSVIRVYTNGVVSAEREIAASTTESFAMTFDRDSFVTVEVEGEATGDYARVLPGATPLAFTNPIFVDANSDGEWTPPGLPLR